MYELLEIQEPTQLVFGIIDHADTATLYLETNDGIVHALPIMQETRIHPRLTLTKGESVVVFIEQEENEPMPTVHGILPTERDHPAQRNRGGGMRTSTIQK
jgi:hypothetical protein